MKNNKNTKKRPLMPLAVKNKNLKTLLIVNAILYLLALFFSPTVITILGLLSAILLVWLTKKPVAEDEEVNDEETKDIT